MNFELNKSIALLERSPSVYAALFANPSHDWHVISEGKNTWSGYNVMGHLIHGEKTDWIPRAEIILGSQENKTFEPYDRHAQDRLYASQSMDELLDEFKALREQNLASLKSWSLTDEYLDKKGMHPEIGAVTLRELIAMWAIHDMVHLNQVSRVIAKHYADDIGPWRQFNSLLNN